MLNNDMTLNAQWQSRPDDQRYLTLQDLHNAVSARRQRSHSVGVALDYCEVVDDGPDLSLVAVGQGDAVLSRGTLNHWSFGQLCQRVGAPAAYLRKLPPALARLPLQWSLETAEREDAKVLMRESGEGLDDCDAINSGSYGRIWDSELTGAALANLGPEWQVPAASYAASDPKRATTLYASDRDVFLFLVDPSKQIEVEGETFFRGFYAWNSEVGSATLGLSTFLLQRVCDNRIIWGQRDKTDIKIRHTSGAPHRFMREATPQLAAYSNAGTAGEVETIKRAKAREVGKDRDAVNAWLKGKGFTGAQSGRIFDAAEKRGKNPRSVWGLVDGATYIAADIVHTDERVSFERQAGKLLETV